MSLTEPPTLRFKNGTNLVPGDRIGTVKQVFPGIGTYAKGGHVYASALGQMNISPSDGGAPTDGKSQYKVSIIPKRPLASSQVISPRQLVLGRVLRVSAPQCTVEIIAIEGIGAIDHPSEGSISRDECVKSGNATREVQECFQPGDIILAKVLSLGDARRYFLTTAESELGVIHAICSSSGQPMIPCSWKEMQCPDTNIKEPRKCAKPRKIERIS